MKKFLGFYLFMFLLLAFGRSGFAFNPMLYFKSEVNNFSPDSEFSVGIFINSDNPVNVFDIEVEFPPKELEFTSFNNANSLVDYWIIDPQITRDGIIKFQGGVSKKFFGAGGEIIRLNFRAKTEGEVRIRFFKTDVYYADGLGTLAESETKPIDFSISSKFARVALESKEDKNPPLISNTQIVNNPTDNSKLVVFKIKDEESGIKATFARERKWISWDEWRPVSNPVLLASGIWTIELKVFDNQNNFSQRTIYIWVELFKKISVLFIVFLIVFLIIRLNKRKGL